MKWVIIIGVLLYNDYAHAQQKSPVTFYDIIKELAIPETGVAGFMIGDWSQRDKSSSIQWTSKDGLEWTETGFALKGLAYATLPGILLDCVDRATKKNTVCPWMIILQGPRAGYMNFLVSSVPHSRFSNAITIDSLFGNHSFIVKPIKNCSGNTSFDYFELNLPGKKPLWALLSRITSAGKTLLILNCYLEPIDPEPVCK